MVPNVIVKSDYTKQGIIDMNSNILVIIILLRLIPIIIIGIRILAHVYFC
jgi:hypothetical protein